MVNRIVEPLPIVYSEKQVTPFGGMSLMKRFIDQTGIRNFLDELDLSQPGSNRGYDPKHIIESFWLGIWTGAGRYIHCDWLRYDKTLHDIFGWEEMPSQSIYSRFFGKFLQKRNTEVFPEMQNWFFDQLRVENITVDFHSTVITRDGDQQGSAKGFNPNKRGRNSRHPLMAFVTSLDLPLDQVWNMYNTRADCENRIKELKADFGLENFCLQDFWGTEASFRFIMVAYNLMSLFRYFALNHHNRARLKTLKSYCFALGAWTVNHAKKRC